MPGSKPLHAAVGELAARQPIPVTVSIDGQRQPSEPVALAVYYVVSEAFTNAAKYSAATQVMMRLSLAEPVSVQVTDNGRGGAQVRLGHGLSGMIERIQALGGRCTISSPSGGPTSIVASLPDQVPPTTRADE